MFTYVVVMPNAVEVYVDATIAEARWNALTKEGKTVQLFRRVTLGIPQELTDGARSAIRNELGEVEALLGNHASLRSDILAALRRAEDLVAAIDTDGNGKHNIVDHMAEARPAGSQR